MKYTLLIFLSLMPSYVFGKVLPNDQRVIIDVDDQRVSSLGLLIFKSVSRFCTATIVSDRLVLTSKHCIPEDPQNNTFLQGSGVKDSSKSFIKAHKVKLFFEETLDVDPSVSSGGREVDYAFLDADPGDPRINFKRFESRVKEGQVIELTSYTIKSIVADALPYVESCKVIKKLNDVLFLHTCSTEPVSSGSPIWMKKNGSYEVVGVHVAGANENLLKRYKLEPKYLNSNIGLNLKFSPDKN